jgi:hypothetical protein
MPVRPHFAVVTGKDGQAVVSGHHPLLLDSLVGLLIPVVVIHLIVMQTGQIVMQDGAIARRQALIVG